MAIISEKIEGKIISVDINSTNIKSANYDTESQVLISIMEVFMNTKASLGNCLRNFVCQIPRGSFLTNMLRGNIRILKLNEKENIN